MNLRKKVLIICTSSLLFGAILLSFVPFVGSLAPSDKNLEKARAIEISTIPLGSSRIIHTQSSKKITSDKSATYIPGEAILIARGIKNNFYTYYLPTWENKILMPNSRWGQHDGYCTELTIKATSRGKEQIQCKDSQASFYFSKYWFWNLDGSNLSGKLPNLISVWHKVKNGTLYVAQN